LLKGEVFKRKKIFPLTSILSRQGRGMKGRRMFPLTPVFSRRGRGRLEGRGRVPVSPPGDPCGPPKVKMKGRDGVGELGLV